DVRVGVAVEGVGGGEIRLGKRLLGGGGRGRLRAGLVAAGEAQEEGTAEAGNPRRAWERAPGGSVVVSHGFSEVRGRGRGVTRRRIRTRCGGSSGGPRRRRCWRWAGPGRSPSPRGGSPPHPAR